MTPNINSKIGTNGTNIDEIGTINIDVITFNLYHKYFFELAHVL